MTRSTRALAVTAAVAVALSGCGLRERIQPTTTGTSTPASSATTATPWSSATSEDLGTLTGSGRPMDEGELRAALPSAGDLGADWEDDPAKTVSETQAAQVTPSSCAPLLQKGVNVNLPIADNTSEKPDTQEQTVVHVDAQQNLYVNNLPYTEAEVVDRIRFALEERAERIVYLKGDTEAPYGANMKMMDKLREAGIENVALITETRKAEGEAGGGD